MKGLLPYLFAAMTAGCAHISQRPVIIVEQAPAKENYILRRNEIEKVELGIPSEKFLQVRVNRIDNEDYLAAISAGRYLLTEGAQEYLKHFFDKGEPCAWGLITNDSSSERDFLAIKGMKTLRGQDVMKYINNGDKVYGTAVGLCPIKNNDNDTDTDTVYTTIAEN